MRLSRLSRHQGLLRGSHSHEGPPPPASIFSLFRTRVIAAALAAAGSTQPPFRSEACVGPPGGSGRRHLSLALKASCKRPQLLLQTTSLVCEISERGRNVWRPRAILRTRLLGRVVCFRRRVGDLWCRSQIPITFEEAPSRHQCVQFRSNSRELRRLSVPPAGLPQRPPGCLDSPGRRLRRWRPPKGSPQGTVKRGRRRRRTPLRRLLLRLPPLRLLREPPPKTRRPLALPRGRMHRLPKAPSPPATAPLSRTRRALHLPLRR